MKKKIRKYLSTKKIESYSNIDNVFNMYLNDKIKGLLSEYDDVEMFPSLSENNKEIQINFKYQNIVTTIDFWEEKYDYVIYPIGIDPYEIDKLFIDCNYSEGFDLETLFLKLNEKIRNHKDLRDISSEKRRKKKYRIISTICFFIPLIWIGVMALYVFISGDEIQLDFWWLLFLLIIPQVLWTIFDKKSVK